MHQPRTVSHAPGCMVCNGGLGRYLMDYIECILSFNIRSFFNIVYMSLINGSFQFTYYGNDSYRYINNVPYDKMLKITFIVNVCVKSKEANGKF